jgi:hypothetical protein
MVDIVQIKKRTNKDAIEMLEEAIVMIKAGNITDVAIAYVISNGSIGYEVSEGKQSILLGAALNMADRTFHKLIDEQ